MPFHASTGGIQTSNLISESLVGRAVHGAGWIRLRLCLQPQPARGRRAAAAQRIEDLLPALARRYNAMSIPMLLVLSGGRVVATQVGALGRDALMGWLERSMAVAAGPS